MKDFKPGDKVTLKTGGPAMVVSDIPQSGIVYCIWWFEGKFDTKGFHKEVLKESN